MLKPPLTIRGFFALLLGSFLVVVIGLPQTDIVATTLGVMLLCTIVTLATLSLFRKKHLVKELSITLSPSEQPLTAATPQQLLFRISTPTIPFPLQVLITFTFTRGQKITAPLLLQGDAQEEILIPVEVTFPHRGVWRIVEASAQLTDIAGFISSTFTLPQLINTAITVRAGGEPSHNLPPVVSSSYRDGETVIKNNAPEGEPYHLKRYDPTDGIKKIVWKVFARSGELISRHIEPSLTPEGQVIVYTIASEFDDASCLSTLHYTEELERLGLQIFCGCEGMEDMPIATSSRELNELLLDSVWFTRKGVGSVAREFADFISRCERLVPASSISTVVFFSTEGRLLERNFYKKDLLKIKEFLEQRSITPILHLEAPLPPPSSLLKKLLYKEPAPLHPVLVTEPIARDQLKQTLQSWDVIRG